MPQTFIMDFDDFTVHRNMELLLKIKEHYPNFRVTAFTIPYAQGLSVEERFEEKYKEWAELIKTYDWIEVGVHGLAHGFGECDIADYDEVEKFMKATEELLDRIGIKYSKIFKAPYWIMSETFYDYLKARGWVVAVDRNNIPAYSKNDYIYNWSFDEPIPTGSIIKGHGHFIGTNNGIDVCFSNLLKLPTDAEFLTIGESLNGGN